jgi:large subunit ribosomal protein L16
MLSPKKTTYQKTHRRDSKKNQKINLKLVKGSFGLKSLSCSRLSSQQIDASQRAMLKKMNRVGKILLRVFPGLSITEKPSEVRMGKGKGNISYWCYPVKVGEIIFEFQGISRHIAEKAGRLGTNKLPVKTKLIMIKQKN